MSPCSSAWPVKGVGEGSAGAGAEAASSRERRRASARSRASCAAETGPVASWFVSDGAAGGKEVTRVKLGLSRPLGRRGGETVAVLSVIRRASRVFTRSTGHALRTSASFGLESIS